MTQQRQARITGTGSYVPSRVLSNADLEKMVDTSDEWIVSRTGIRERRIAAENEFPSDMGVNAATKALEAAGLEANQLDMIIVATMTPDYLAPSTAAIIQAKLPNCQAAAFDIEAACTGFIYVLSMAKAFVDSGMYHNVLVVATEKMSAFIDYQDRNTCVIFGDGAAAAVVQAEGRGLLLDTMCLGADGEHSQLGIIPAGGACQPACQESLQARAHFFHMDGKTVFKQAVRRMSAAAKHCLEKANVPLENIQWLIPHQANERIINALAKDFSFPLERVYKTLARYGNTSGSSIAIALDELFRQHPPKPGDHYLLIAFGVGLTWGAALLTQTH